MTNEQFREMTGSVTSDHPLVCLLYEIMRDHVPVGVVEQMVANLEKFHGHDLKFTNGWLAQHAKNMVVRLMPETMQDNYRGSSILIPGGKGRRIADGEWVIVTQPGHFYRKIGTATVHSEHESVLWYTVAVGDKTAMVQPDQLIPLNNP